jgi:hypothetical protein
LRVSAFPGDASSFAGYIGLLTMIRLPTPVVAFRGIG